LVVQVVQVVRVVMLLSPVAMVVQRKQMRLQLL
jgi:hypothetical protein